MKKTFLILVMVFLGLNVHAAEKQIYGKIENKYYCTDHLEKKHELALQLTLYYGELPDEDVYTIDNTTGTPKWKGLISDMIKDTFSFGDFDNYYDINSCTISLLFFDKSMLDADIVSTSHWFENMAELKYVYGLENLNMSHVTDMSYMFAGCSKLRCLDMSGFKFTATTNTTNMFDGCSSIQFIKAPSSLSKIGNERLFYGIGTNSKPCYIATPDDYDYEVGVSESFFIYKSGYFIDCKNEIYYYVLHKTHGFDGKECTVLRYDKLRYYIDLLWDYCALYNDSDYQVNYFLKQYFLDFAYDQEVKTDVLKGDVPIWFYNYGSTYFHVDYHEGNTIIDSSFFNYCPISTNKWFKGIVNNLVLGEGFDEEYSYYFYTENDYIDMSFEGLEYINTSNVIDMSEMFSESKVKAFDFKTLNTSNVINMACMFAGSYYTELDLSHFNTSNVTNMGYMFSHCFYLESLDLSNFNTSNVTNMKGMFYCMVYNDDYSWYDDRWKPKLCDLNISSFDMSNVTNSEYMLAGLSSLRDLWISPTMNKLDETACEGVGTETDPCVIHAPEGFNFGVDTSGDYFVWKSGYFRLPDTPVPYVVLSEDKKTLTFIYDNNRPEYDGITYSINNENAPEWLVNKQTITKVVFDGTFKNAHPKTASSWFAGMNSLQTIEGLENLNTENVIYFTNMFNGCSKLSAINPINFITSKATNFSGMFNGCSSLSSLDLSNFDTSKAANFSGMFNDCSGLTSLDLSNFDTSKANNFSEMFNGCSSLTSLNLSNFKTTNATYLSSMFQGCSSLLALDLSSFITTYATNLSSMFQDCSSLTNLDLGSFDTSSATNMNSIFKGCSSLESLDLSHFTIGENTQTAEMMSGCFALGRLLISSTMNRLEPDACLGVGTTTSPCEIKAPSGFDFGVSTSGDYFRWKGGCFAITSEEYANISSDGTTIIFYCDGKRSSRSGTTYDLQLSGKPDWSSQAATITKAVIDPSFSFARPVTVRSWFEGMKNLKVIEGIENLNTSEAEYTSYMFQNCSSIEYLDLGNFDTRKVKLMGYMFKGCRSLKSVDISNFDSGICTSFFGMFDGCSKLTSLDLSSLTINENADSRGMLKGCTALEELTIPASAGYFNAAAFATVGTSDAPCIIHAPEGFDFGTDTGSAFQWKGGWFVLHTPATITASVASLSPGNAAQLIVRMNNSAASSYNGFEMVVHLPEGMSIAKKGNDFDCKLGGRCSGMSVSVSNLGNGLYRIMGYSLSNATISGTEGALFLLSISCPENVPVGSYTGTLEDISLSTTAGTGEEPDDVTFPITVSQYRMGDVDLNGKINVIDVMLVVSHILGDKLNNFHAEYADMDGNGKINVLDVTTIIDVILNSPYMNQQAPERVSHTTHLTQLPASGGVVLALDGTERFTACQMDVRLEGGAMLRDVKLIGGNASSHSVKYSRISNDIWRVVVYSAKGTTMENGAPLLQLLTDSKGGSQQVTIENVELCSELFDSVTPECVEGSATAITNADTDIQEVPTYTIQGIRIAKPQRGVNIRKGTKVTVK